MSKAYSLKARGWRLKSQITRHELQASGLKPQAVKSEVSGNGTEDWKPMKDPENARGKPGAGWKPPQDPRKCQGEPAAGGKLETDSSRLRKMRASRFKPQASSVNCEWASYWRLETGNWTPNLAPQASPGRARRTDLRQTHSGPDRESAVPALRERADLEFDLPQGTPRSFLRASELRPTASRDASACGGRGHSRAVLLGMVARRRKDGRSRRGRAVD